MEREELEYYLDFIQALIPNYDRWLKSERDPAKIANYKRQRKDCQQLEQILLPKISWHDSVSKIAQWKKELSSPDVDTAPPVTLEEFIETETSPDKVLPDPWPPYSQWSRPFPPPRPTVRRQLSRRQFVEEMLESEKIHKTVLEAEILQHEGALPRWMEILRALPGFEPYEFPKKPAAESVQVGNPGSPPVNNAPIEAESVVEPVQAGAAATAQASEEAIQPPPSLLYPKSAVQRGIRVILTNHPDFTDRQVCLQLDDDGIEVSSSRLKTKARSFQEMYDGAGENKQKLEVMISDVRSDMRKHRLL